MRRLKVLIGSMTALIAAAVIMLIWGISLQVGKVIEEADILPIQLPKNAKIIHMSGQEEQITLFVTIDGVEYIYPYNLSKHTQGRRIAVKRD